MLYGRQAFENYAQKFTAEGDLWRVSLEGGLAEIISLPEAIS